MSEFYFRRSPLNVQDGKIMLSIFHTCSSVQANSRKGRVFVLRDVCTETVLHVCMWLPFLFESFLRLPADRKIL